MTTETETHVNLMDDTMITCNLAKQKQYAFTLRRTNLKHGVTEDDYLKHVAKFQIPGIKLIDYVFEQTAGLHMHGILEIPTNYSNFNRLRVRGWNIRVDELYNRQGWIVYYLKDQYLNVNP